MRVLLFVFFSSFYCCAGQSKTLQKNVYQDFKQKFLVVYPLEIISSCDSALTHTIQLNEHKIPQVIRKQYPFNAVAYIPETLMKADTNELVKSSFEVKGKTLEFSIPPQRTIKGRPIQYALILSDIDISKHHINASSSYYNGIVTFTPERNLIKVLVNFLFWNYETNSAIAYGKSDVSRDYDISKQDSASTDNLSYSLIEGLFDEVFYQSPFYRYQLELKVRNDSFW